MKQFAWILLVAALLGGWIWTARQLAGSRREASELARALEGAPEAKPEHRSPAPSVPLQGAQRAAGKPGAGAGQPGTEPEQSPAPMDREALRTMLQDPQLKEMVAAQQKAVTDVLIDQMLAGGLAEELNLDEPQRERLKAVLSRRALGQAELALQSLALGVPGDPAALQQQMEAFHAASRAELEALLGREGLERVEWYEKTQGERMKLEQFRAQLASQGMDLPVETHRNLLLLMAREREQLPIGQRYDDPLNPVFDFSEASLNAYFEQQARLDENVLNRARAVLSPEQWLAFEKFQKQQLELQKAMTRIAAQMFAPRQEAETATK